MDPADMRKRLIRSYDWSGHFTHCLDGIPEIQHMPGGGIDGCRMHKEVRAIVMGLIERIQRLEAIVSTKADVQTPPDQKT